MSKEYTGAKDKSIINQLDDECYLKSCTFDDIPALVQIAQTTYQEHYPYLWKDKGVYYIANHYNAAAFEKELSDKNAISYLIFYKNTICGFLKLNQNAPLNVYTSEEAIELERIYLSKAVVGRGLGQSIMQSVAQIAQSLNKKVIWLKTMDSSGADRFYQKCGYEVCGKTVLAVEGIYEHLQGQLIMMKQI